MLGVPITPGQEELGEVFFRQESSYLQDVPKRNVNHPNTCWKDSTRGHKHSVRLLECVDDTFQTQGTEELMMGGDLMNSCI